MFYLWLPLGGAFSFLFFLHVCQDRVGTSPDPRRSKVNKAIKKIREKKSLDCGVAKFFKTVEICRSCRLKSCTWPHRGVFCQNRLKLWEHFFYCEQIILFVLGLWQSVQSTSSETSSSSSFPGLSSAGQLRKRFIIKMFRLNERGPKWERRSFVLVRKPQIFGLIPLSQISKVWQSAIFYD